MTLRSKVLLAQAPLAVVLAVVLAASVKTISALGRSPEIILKDNYRSVLAAENMTRAVEGLQRLALAHASGRAGPGDPGALRARFERELALQEHNITERGEVEITSRLRRSWEAYLASYDRVAAASGPAALAAYFEALDPAYARVQAAADEVLALNQDAMASKSERARRAAQRNNAVVIGVALAALVVGLFVSLTLTARLLRPVGVLAQAARRIGEGDLEARAVVAGGDEIAQLAREFNTMADRLGQYRSSSLGELLQAQQSSQAAIDSLPDPVLVVGAGSELMNLNAAAESMLRLGGSGAPASVSALAPGVRELVERVLAHVLAGRGPYVPRGFEEAVRVDAPEGDRQLLPRATPLHAERGGVIGATVVLQDVTRLMRFDELKNDLVATVAHEFRTPLTSLRMAIHLCAEEVVGPLTEKQADLMLAARQDCERLQGIVDDLLDLSRIQAGRMALRRDRLDATAVIGGALAAVRPAADAGGIALTAPAPREAVAVLGDAERVQLVLTNLLANAIRHTPQGGRIDVTVGRGDGMARLEVRDTGEGIAPEHLERIFDKFYRVPGARSGGVGLGLYLAREIVQAHGGDIGATSEPGRGSVFWLTLPLAEDAPAPA